MISHRPKFIGHADWIILLENGRLKNQGTSSELRQIKGEHLEFLDDFLPHKNGFNSSLAISH